MRRKTPVAVMAAMALMAFSAAALAQGRGIAGESEAPAREPEKWAVVIGVGAYTGGLTPLPNAVSDAKAVYQALTAGGLFPADNVVLMTDDAPNPLHRPTRSNILGLMGEWLALAQPSDAFLVYFAGHGVDKDGRLHLMPLDARTNNIDLTSIPYEVFESELEKSKARLSLVVLDACHSATGRGDAPMTRGMMQDLEKYSDGRILLASCKEDELSHEMPNTNHGAFTYYFIEGLTGAADTSGDKVVSAKELSNYTFDRVSKWSRRNQLRQTPRLKADISGDFVLAKVHAVTSPQPHRPPTVVTPEPAPPTPSAPSAGSTRTVDLGGGVTMELVWVPPGEFMMGSPSSDGDAQSDEKPAHKVRVTKGFWMGKYEVTQKQWQAVMGSNPSRFKGDSNPVEQVSWNDCQEFLKKAGGGLRLPTEAEWEYACRAGTTTPFHFGETISTEQANYDGDYTYGNGRKGEDRQKTVPVGSFPANAWGLHDMHGNVWEWCEDWYGEGYYASSPAADPTGPTSGSLRVDRGGSWNHYPRGCRSAYRGRGTPDYRNHGLGFRVVLPVGQ